MKKKWSIAAACLLILICALGLFACKEDDDGGTNPLPDDTVYTVTFVADGITVGTDTYTAEDRTVTEPEVPFKAGYIGVWESYTLTVGNVTVNAVYTEMSPAEAIIGTFYRYVGGESNKDNYFTFGEDGAFEAYIVNSPPVNGSYTIDENANITFTLEMNGATYNGDGTLNRGVIVLNMNGQYEILCQEGATPYADANGAKYVVYRGSAILSGYAGTEASFSVPGSVAINSAEYEVKAVAEYAFRGCGSLTSVTIGENVTSIGNYAFYNCTSLKKVIMSDSLVKTIGISAFEGCRAIETIALPYVLTGINHYAFYNCSGLINITIPDSVTSIGTSAFSECSGLTSITISDSVTSIDTFAFNGCSGLTNITIPDSMTSISHNAFNECSGLTSITIPDSVTSIGYDAFNECSGLTSIVYNGTTEQWEAISKESNWNRNTGNYVITCTNGTINK